MNYWEALRRGTEYLEDHGIEDPASDAKALLQFCCRMSREEYLLRSRETIPEDEKERYLAALARRGKHIPLQHVTGEQYFMGYRFLVNESVLIPRWDTEVLVEEALTKIRPGDRVLDLCTGSGCIAVSVKKMCPDAEVTASDLSVDALQTAGKNADLLGASVSFVRSDLFESLPGMWDVILSNPPYIPTAEIEELAEEVRLHDPRIALDGGTDGLDFYRRIIEACPARLRKGGWILLEIGYNQAEAVSGLLRQTGFSEIYTKADLNRLDRIVAGRMDAKRESISSGETAHGNGGKRCLTD